MNCLVCVKQVPDTDKVSIDPIRHTLVREGAASILNPYDGYALELALRLRESTGGTVTVLTMGPPQAKDSLEKCLAVGADAAWLISGREFSGADTLATGYTLARAIQYLSHTLALSFDLILCGKQAIDGDTAQVGPVLAEFLNLPQITSVREILPDGDRIRAIRQTAHSEQILDCGLPALITVSATPWPLRIPTLRSKLAARKIPIPVLTNAELKLEPDRCGLKGSPTRVIATSASQRESRCVFLKDTAALAETLSQLGFAKGGARHDKA